MVTVKVIAVVDERGDSVKNVINGIKGRGALDSCNWSRFPFISKEFLCANNLERFIVGKPKSNIVLGDGKNAVAIDESIKLEVELFSHVTNEIIKTKIDFLVFNTGMEVLINLDTLYLKLIIYCHTLNICDTYKRNIFYSKIINL
jgi:hypothetical protein